MAIERKFVAQNLKEFRIKEFVSSQLSRVGLSSIKLQRTPLGDKILIRASRPGLVVGRAGSNIQKLTEALKVEFNLENPQIEIEEVEQIGLDANIIAEMIVNSMERFGSQRFKGVGHRAVGDVMGAGALGVEILISGKVPSQRSRTWRFYQGYLKKCGDVAISGVDVAYKTAVLKSGVVGVKVSIMPPTTKLPDQILIHEPDPATVEEVTDEKTKKEMSEVVEKEEKGSEAKAEKKAPKKSTKKSASKESNEETSDEALAAKPDAAESEGAKADAPSAKADEAAAKAEKKEATPPATKAAEKPEEKEAEPAPKESHDEGSESKPAKQKE